MKKYFVYVDDGSENVMRIAVPANNETKAAEYVKGNGEVVAIKDITKDYPIDLNYVAEVLNGCFGKTETDLIMRTLMITNIAE